ncbi:hypothetical protein [Paraliomyxa miuraensis]|uniref:hypothetical protein n=1 Tax=Paraliomyxa miuraensis TaxID=376150 RepID=UPI0022505013|nr:hypothetical protein [Paraliomyxa miuraensis]MCX4247887.1 hypothetical protein [Paraliomyxa miuraensis]
MHRLAWRFLIASSFPLALAACPAADDTATTLDTANNDTEMSTGGSTTATTLPMTTTGPDDTTTTGEESSGSSTTTGEGSSSTGPVADTGESGGEVSVCGNNQIEGDEVCDLSQVNGETCQSLGYQGGQLGCLLTCDDYNLLGCFICGNEVVDIAEDCEGEVQEGVTCESLGYEAGDITCGADCLYDLSECSICGDGIQQGPENCDGIDFGGETCVSLGFDAGNLACNLANCSFNFSNCSGGQYIQDFEGGVMPAQFTGGGNANWVVDNMMPIAGGFSAHSGVIGHSQQSQMNVNVNMAVAGTIDFAYSISSEACCDYLRFYVDGVQVVGAQWSGVTSGMASYPVAAGAHTLQWRYQKDGSIVAGSDRAWVDNIVLVGGVPI